MSRPMSEDIAPSMNVWVEGLVHIPSYNQALRKKLTVATPFIHDVGFTVHTQKTGGNPDITPRRRFAVEPMSLIDFAATIIDLPGKTRDELVAILLHPDDSWGAEHYHAAKRRFTIALRRLNERLPNLIVERHQYGEPRRYYPYPDAREATKRLFASGMRRPGRPQVDF